MAAAAEEASTATTSAREKGFGKRKQNVSLRSTSGMHFRWVSFEEIDRMVEAGQVRRVSTRKDPRQVYQLVAHPSPNLASENSRRTALSLGDMEMLANLEPFYVARLDVEKVRKLSPSKLQRLQRLAGWGLIPRNDCLENAGEP